VKALRNLNKPEDSLKLADNILSEVMQVFDDNEIEYQELREKIAIYFKNRAAPSADEEDESQNEENGFTSSGLPRRSVASIRVRDTTRKIKKAAHLLAGQQAATYLSE
jgi:hypothetical protein